MTQKEGVKTRARELWKGKPWILPNILARSALIVAVGVVVSWLEFSFDIAARETPVLKVAYILWTALAILLIWVLSLTHLLLLRASNTYVLRNDGLEVRTGIITSRSSVIAPAGFSDLEVTRSVSARIVNSGDITIRTQGDTDIKMVKVRNPLRVADQIREVMSRPTVRIEGRQPIIEKT